jgi:hypothetical protein
VKPRKFLLAAILPLTLLPYRAEAQLLDQIQTESDWETLLDQGYIDYNSYQLYREMAEGTEIKDTSDYIQTAMGNPLSDFISPEGTGESMEKSGSTLGHYRFRTGQKVQEKNSSGYILLSSSKQNAKVEFKGRNDNDSWQTDRRSINLADDIYNVTIGNYTADIGSGLGIGRYDYRPVGIPKDSLAPDFLFPDNSYYNGARIDINNRYTFLFSSKKYLSIQKRFLGGAASFINSDYRIGVTAAATSLSSGGNHRSLGEGSIFLTNPDMGLSFEAGYAESGAGIVSQFHRNGYDVKFWHYDDSFVNLQCSAMAYPDYTGFQDENYPITFRQPQSGESGLSLRRGLMLGRLYLIGLSSLWKRSPGDPAALDNTLGARLSLGDYWDFNGRYSERTGHLPGRTLSELGSDFQSWFQASALISLWYDGDGSNRDRSFAQIYVSFPLKSSFSASGRLRSHFDGKLEYFVEERTVIANRLTLKATYRWQDSYERQGGPLYLVMETEY